MSQPSAPFQVTSCFGKASSSRSCGFVSVSARGVSGAAARRVFAVPALARGSLSAQTSRGVTESWRRNTSVSPVRSSEAPPFTSGPRVSASTRPSRLTR